jgi:hypothetical protein
MHCLIVFPFFLKYMTNTEYMISSWPIVLEAYISSAGQDIPISVEVNGSLLYS